MIVKLDENNRVQDYTFILSKRDHTHLGQLNLVSDWNITVGMNEPDEISFSYYKYPDIIIDDLSEIEKQQYKLMWDELTDFKFIYVKELNEYFEIEVETVDEGHVTKQVTGKGACEVELGQVNLYGLEINTENDILRDDYVVTKFYDPINKDGSLLHRVLSSLPQYSIGTVDKTLWHLQRVFDCDGDDAYSFLTSTVAEEIGCIFTFNSVDRTINAYDLKTNCADCGYRGEFNEVCPKCGSTALQYFGEETSIFVDTDNLSDEITFTTDVGSVKNTFKLVGGDENMTAAIRNVNPSGSSYIYYFSEDAKHDMPKELVDKMESYDALVEERRGEYELCVKNVYKYMDDIMYYTHSMMPNEQIVDKLPNIEDAKEGIFYLIKPKGESFIYDEYIYTGGEFIHIDSVTRYENTTSTIELNKILGQIPMDDSAFFSVSKLNKGTSVTTVNTYLTSYLKNFYLSGYFIATVECEEYHYLKEEDGVNWAIWSGYITMKNSSEPEDIKKSELKTFLISDQYDAFVQQKVEAKLSTLKDEEGSIYDVINIRIYNDDKTINYEETLEKFKYAIDYYCLNRLTSFLDAIQGAIDIMIEENQANKSADLYNTLYIPYLDKLVAVQSEIDERKEMIDDLTNTLNLYQSRMRQIQDELNFEKYLGTELYKTFCCYKREQVYQNDNYIADGMENNELIENAKSFLEAARDELYKSGEYQHSISGNIFNLFTLEQFNAFKDKFEIGNFIRCRVDDKKYKLRLIRIGLSSNNKKVLDVEFSDITKVKNGITDVASILAKATSMASSYGALTNQVKNQEETVNFVSNFMDYGLSATNVKIVNDADNQSVLIDGSGITTRKKDVFNNVYEDCQLKIINNGIYTTSDNWRTVNTGLGKFISVDPVTGNQVERYGLIADTVQGNLILGNNLGIYSNDDTRQMKFNNNGLYLLSKEIDGKYSSIFEIAKEDSSGNIQDLLLIDSDGSIIINSDVVFNGSLNSNMGVTTTEGYIEVAKGEEFRSDEIYYIWEDD